MLPYHPIAGALSVAAAAGLLVSAAVAPAAWMGVADELDALAAHVAGATPTRSRGSGSDRASDLDEHTTQEPAADDRPAPVNRTEPVNRTDPVDRTSVDEAPPGPPIGYGMHVSGLRTLYADPTRADVAAAVDHGQVWVGSWNLQWGWKAIGEDLEWMVQNNITPVVQVFYWGNDISRDCVRDGCYASGTYKSRAGWSQLATELADALDEHLQGRAAIVVLEPEFNKGHVATFDLLDDELAERAREVRSGYDPAVIALGFGGWAPQFWDTWDDAMAASDAVALQLMRGATRDGHDSYADAAETLLHQARILHDLSGKPVIVSDVALSSYPGGAYLELQAQELGEVLQNRDELRAAGVEVVVYRSLVDDPGATTKEYFGQAERSWGLMYANGTAKPAWNVWLDSVRGA